MDERSLARLVVVTVPELAAGFRLAGVQTRTAETPSEAERIVLELVEDPETGVIAVHEPFLVAIPSGQRLGDLVRPVVVALPTGELSAASQRRAHLTDMLARAVGYRLTFRPDES